MVKFSFLSGLALLGIALWLAIFWKTFSSESVHPHHFWIMASAVTLCLLGAGMCFSAFARSWARCATFAMLAVIPLGHLVVDILKNVALVLF